MMKRKLYMEMYVFNKMIKYIYTYINFFFFLIMCVDIYVYILKDLNLIASIFHSVIIHNTAERHKDRLLNFPRIYISIKIFQCVYICSMYTYIVGYFIYQNLTRFLNDEDNSLPYPFTLSSHIFSFNLHYTYFK